MQKVFFNKVFLTHIWLFSGATAIRRKEGKKNKQMKKRRKTHRNCIVHHKIDIEKKCTKFKMWRWKYAYNIMAIYDRNKTSIEKYLKWNERAPKTKLKQQQKYKRQNETGNHTKCTWECSSVAHTNWKRVPFKLKWNEMNIFMLTYSDAMLWMWMRITVIFGSHHTILTHTVQYNSMETHQRSVFTLIPVHALLHNLLHFIVVKMHTLHYNPCVTNDKSLQLSQFNSISMTHEHTISA